ncbi:photosynthetic protein synthase I [Haladaptatus sp. W1]|uniref:SCO family protein n=1 Tax=Haladaptatus sp. W1 TaxID=1897478 RepID=UPI000849A8BB|nr:SCO family protein [Haladaptatus sp. W1]ODR81532.1 photosynthetic protein synthase I [Haladaptatus sp. W1]
MHRRTYLRSVAATGAAVSAAGCLGSLGDSNPNVALSEPDRNVESSDLPYPAWGEKIPDVTIPAPLEDRTVSFRDVETPSIVTFFYTHCMTICPVLISTLRNVQTHATKNGYAKDVTFLPTTFDPQRDDTEQLRTYTDKMNVDQSIDDWSFLRPKSEARAKHVITDTFGVQFEKTKQKSKDDYMFSHSALILLVNEKGYVERAYHGSSPKQQQIIDDLETVRG